MEPCRRQRICSRVCSRGSKDCFAAGSVRSEQISVSSVSPGLFLQQLGGTEPFQLQGSFQSLRKSCWCCRGLSRACSQRRWPGPAAILPFWNVFGTNHSHAPSAFQAQLSRVSQGAIPLYRTVTERKSSPKLQGRSVENNLRLEKPLRCLKIPVNTGKARQKLLPELPLFGK